jgi:hypothetical protein
MTYATRWARLWCILAAVQVGFASLRWSPLAVVLAVLASTASVAAALVMYRNLRRPDWIGPASPSARHLGQTALLAGCCMVAMSTLLAASPVLALLVVVLVVVTSPVVIHRRGRPTPLRATRPDPASTATTGAPSHPDETLGWPSPDGRPLETLDDADLFKLWRRTFWELERQPSVEELAWLVELRQSCLDELSRRNPTAMAAWLSSGARASGGPERFWPERPGPPGDAPSGQ